jgi:glycosyltransferase involved in cell wall biosynthesis
MSQPRICVLALQPGLIGAYGVLLADGLHRASGGAADLIADARLRSHPLLQDVFARLEPRFVDSRSLRGRLTANPRVLTMVLRGRYRAVYDTAGSSLPTYLPLRLVLALMTRLVVTEHDPAAHSGQRSFWRDLSRALMRRFAPFIHVHGEACADLLRERGVAEARIVIARHGAYRFYDRGAYAGQARNWREVLFFGALRPNKGVDWLPEIARAMAAAAPDARLVVAGSLPARAPSARTDWRDTLDAHLDALRAMPNVAVDARFIPDEEVELYFRRAGICLAPYKDATQSGVVAIALPFGQAVVATRTGDIPDVVTDGETGRLAPVSAEAVTAALLDVLRTLGAAARAFADEALDWAAIGRNLLCRPAPALIAGSEG